MSGQLAQLADAMSANKMTPPQSTSIGEETRVTGSGPGVGETIMPNARGKPIALKSGEVRMAPKITDVEITEEEWKSFMGDITDTASLSRLVIKKFVAGVSPGIRMRHLLKNHMDSARFFIKVHLYRGSSWYKYVKGDSVSAAEMAPTYIMHATNLGFALTKGATKTSSPLSTAVALSPFLAYFRARMEHYVGAFSMNEERIEKRFQFTGALAVMVAEDETKESYRQNFPEYVIAYGVFIQEYVDSFNKIKTNPAPATIEQRRAFWYQLIRGCHYAANAFSIKDRVEWKKENMKMPQIGVFKYMNPVEETVSQNAATALTTGFSQNSVKLVKEAIAEFMI